MFTHRLHFLKLESWLLIAISSLCLLLSILFAGISYYLVSQTIEKQTGEKALSLAHFVSKHQAVIHSLESQNASEKFIADIESFRLASGADFIVIGDTKLKRYSHPDSNKIGKNMVGGDSQRALNGENYVSTAKGSLGISIRGKVPIYNLENHIIGLVSVGFLQTSLRELITDRRDIILITLICIFVLATLVAFYIAHRVKKQLHGLQPQDIARLYIEQKTIFNTVKIGLMILNPDGSIRKLNNKAKTLFELSTTKGLNNQNVSNLFPALSHQLSANKHKEIQAMETIYKGKRWVISSTPFQFKDNTYGLLLTINLFDEVTHLSAQLAKVEKFSEMLRMQTHDYSNKLNTLAALLQLKSYDKALALISHESQDTQAQIQQLLNRISNPTLAGLILGKYHKANELKIQLDIEIESAISDIQSTDKLAAIISIFGNLVDNAMDAALKNQQFTTPQVLISLEQTGNSILFDVEDSGAGLSDSEYLNIFNPNYSSKNEPNHGFGMYLVKTHLDAYKGTLEFADSNLGGARFSVYIPTP